MIRKLSIRSWGLLGLLVTFTAVIGLHTQAQTIEDVIPGDSLVYLKLQNLKACRETIDISADWKETADIISATPKWQPVSQFMQMLPAFLGTDVQGVIETFLGGGLALTVSPGVEGLMIGIVIENEGSQQQKAEHIFAKFIETVSGMEGNEARLDEGNYRDITYRTAQINEQQLTYGRVNETLFLVGITPGSFNKMIDTYKTEGESIVDTPLYRSVADKFGKREVFAFMNMEPAALFMKLLLPPHVSGELEALRTLVCSWDVLSPGGSLQVYGQLKAARQDTFISRLQENANMQTTQALSGEEGFFLTVTPAIAATIWGWILGPQTAPSTDESVSSFLIPDQTNVLEATAGDVAISADASALYSVRQNSHTEHVRSIDGVIESVGLDFPERNLSLIFNPDELPKWQAFFNGILENLTIESQRQFDYKGITFNAVSIPGTLYYGSVNELFVLAFSEKQCQAIVDNVLTQKPTDALGRRLEQVSPPLGCLFQIDLGAFLTFIASTGDIAWLGKDAMAFTEKIGILSASLAGGEDEAWLEITLLPEEKAVEAVASLVPVIFLGITKDMTFGSQ